MNEDRKKRKKERQRGKEGKYKKCMHEHQNRRKENEEK